jgi:dTDP-4-amino-4,6-dideoxygalactose transaminase
VGYRERQLPESERASREVLSLPIFPELLPEEENHLIGVMRKFLR